MFKYTVTAKSRQFVRYLCVHKFNAMPPSEAATAPLTALQAEVDRAIAQGKLDRDTCNTYFAEYRDQLRTRGNKRASSAPDTVPRTVPDSDNEPDPAHSGASQPGAGGDVEDVLDIMRDLLTRNVAADPEALRALVRDEVHKARITPDHVLITCGTIETKMEGCAHSSLKSALAIMASQTADGRRNNLMLVGPAGSGKTTLSKQVAKALGIPYHYTGAVLSKYDLLGHTTASGDVVRTPFRDAFEHGGLFCFDDFDGSDPRGLVPFNAALDNRICAFPDKVLQAHQDFCVIATANTWGTGATSDYVGRNKLDGATLNRYVRLTVSYDEALELALVGPEFESWATYVQKIRRAAQVQGIKAIISPRQSIQGALCLKAGMTWGDVESTVLFSGMDTATISKLRDTVAGRV